MRVIGTAGHVDHGKSALVEALTGIHPDRLKEEQAREMTIDLGFAWIELPGGEEVGIIDVPGHRDFIENMLAGVGGIDAALFVVAADEGVMPQTREHLAILDLLDIQGGVIALTKVDLVLDDEWLDLVEEEVLQSIENTVLEGAEIVRVSARTKAGLEALTYSLEAVLSHVPARPDLGRPRLPIDRVFTVAGFGTVVTGTLMDGRFAIGDEIEILPQAATGRIRGLQSHKKKSEMALPGSRTAVNIAGVDVDEISRGGVVAHPGQYQPTRRLDVQFRLLPDATLPVQHNDETKLFIGAAEVMGRIRLLGAERLNPGEQGWLQIELREPVVCHRGDHFILRRPSPPETIGGGTILDPHPKRRYKRMHAPTLERLQALAEGDPQDILEQALITSGIAPIKSVVAASMLSQQAAGQAINGLLESKRMLVVRPEEAETLHPQSEALVCSASTWEVLKERTGVILASYHRKNPLRPGMPREELKSRLNLQTRVFAAVVDKLARAGLIEERQSTIALPDHQVEFSVEQKASIEHLKNLFAQAPYSPPSVKESRQIVGDEVYQALVEQGELVQLSQDVVFAAQDYAAIREDFLKAMGENGEMTVAQVRDRYDTSRKYVLALLEHFDAVGLTVRDGDYRRLRISN